MLLQDFCLLHAPQNLHDVQPSALFPTRQAQCLIPKRTAEMAAMSDTCQLRTRIEQTLCPVGQLGAWVVAQTCQTNATLGAKKMVIWRPSVKVFSRSMFLDFSLTSMTDMSVLPAPACSPQLS